MDISNEYIESLKVFKKRRFKFIPLGIFLEAILILLIIVEIANLPNEPIHNLITVMILILAVLTGILLIKRISNGIKMQPFQIKNNKFLASDRKEETWISLAMIEEVRYSLITNAIVITYTEERQKLILEYLALGEILRIIDIFNAEGVKTTEVKGMFKA